ncbi:WD domain, G-beta repeat-containing protein [Toxoplasma gondii TgCatPRC2]|uniref:WD domain, G-beta repeat-containing protein n=1 Tax=Toxoplasma gondii TgCatPRC2 TaxID=1130821 RepID=A0A151HMF8_TOXGO|nr:WD domain, G-beta repeat-containing protein [Toxoplasma gondii TgCatPRC2]
MSVVSCFYPHCRTSALCCVSLLSRSRRVSQLYGGSGIRPFPGCLCPSPLNSPRYFRRSPSTERDSRAAEATGDATQNQERRGDERNSETRTGPDEETREISVLPPTTSSSWSASASCSSASSSSAPSSSAPSSLLHDAATAHASDEGQTGDSRSTSSAAVGRMDGAESQERSGGEEGSNCRSGGDTDKPKALYAPSRPNHEERTQGTSLASPVSETTNDKDTDRTKARGLDTRFSETTVKRPPLQSGLMICLGSNNGDDVSCKDPSMHQTLRHSPPSSSSSPCALSASSSPCSTSTSSLCSTSASTSPCATSTSSSPCGTSTSSSSATSSSLCSTSASSSCSTSASASSSSASSSSRPSPTRPSPPPSSLESCSKSEKRDLRVKQCEKDMESLLSLAFVYLEHSEEATRPLWLHPAVGFSYRCRIPRWQGWPSLSFLRRLIRSKCRTWLMERKEHPRRIEEGEEEEGDEVTSELEAWKGDEENRDLGSTGRRSTGHGAGQLGRKEAREASGDFENVEDECHGNERSGIDKGDMLRRQGRNKRQASRFSPQDSPLSASSNCGATAGATSTASVNLRQQQTADKDVRREPRPSSHRKSKRLRSGSSSSSFSSFSSSTSSSASSFSSTASSSSASFSSFSSSSSSSSASSSSASSSAAVDRVSFTVAQKQNEGASHPENAGPGGGVRRPAGAFLGRRFSRSALDALDEPVSFSESSSDGESRFDIDAYNSDVALDEYCLLCSTGEDAQSGPDGGSDSSEDSDAQAANAPQRREAAERRPGQSEGAEPEAALNVVGRSSGVADAAAGSQAGRCGEEPTAETEPREEETPETEPREEETRTRPCAEETAATGPGGEELSPADPEGDMRAERRVSMSQAIRERRREPGRDGGGSRSSESDGSAGREAASLRDDAHDSHDSDDDLEEFGSSSSDSSWPSFGEEENVSDAPRRRYFWDDSDDDVWPDVDSMHDVGAAPGPWRLPFRTARQAEQYILNANWMPTPHIGRFVGHCNAATDIKEVAFWGTNHVLAGSDDASVLAWRMCDGEVVNILRGHESHVNCVAVHPHGSCIATSGIDDFIKIWTPEGDSPFVLDEAAEKVLRSNQDLMDEENAAARSLFTTFRPGILRHLFASMDRPGEGDREPACNIQ